MFLKLLKSLLALIVLTILLLLISLQYPTHLLTLVNNFTPYTISIKTIKHNIADRNLTFVNTTITHQQNIYTFGTINIDFSSLRIPAISIDSADITLATLQDLTKEEPLSDGISYNLNIQNATLRYKDLILSGTINIANKLLTAQLQPINYHPEYLNYIGESTARTYISNNLKNTTITDIVVQYNINNRKFTLNGAFQDVELIPYMHWQNISAKHINFLLNNDALTLDVLSGTMGNLDISGEQITIDWNNSESVKVDINSDARFEEIASFLRASPVSSKLSTVLTTLKISGDAKTSGHLEFFFNNTPSIIKLSSQLNDTTVSVLNKATFYNTSGFLEVSGSTVNFNGITKILSTPMAVSLEYDNYLTLKIMAKDHTAIITNGKHDETNIWNIALSTDDSQSELSMQGDITLNFKEYPPKIQLDNFALHTTNTFTLDNVDIFSVTNIPSMYIEMNNVSVNSYTLPQLNFTLLKRNNTLSLSNINIRDISANPAHTININTKFKDDESIIDISIQSSNINDLLTILALPNSLESNELIFFANVKCDCPLWELSVDNIFGNIQLSSKEGSIKREVNILTKLLSLLSVKSIGKILNVEDNALVPAEKLTFLSITSEGILSKGELQLNNFNLTSNDTIIELSGTTNITNSTHNLDALVTPLIKDSVPVASLLAGGGLVGLGVWLIDKTVFDEKLLNNITDDLINFDYRITGSWDNPTVE